MTSARTAIVLLLGRPVAHSRSPAMMTSAFTALGLDAVYVACDVAPEALRDAVRGMGALGVRGANVTVPHKRAVMALCDEVTPAARAIGAVNTLVCRNGRITGDNTDADGALAALREAGAHAAACRAVVWGAGGGARAVAVGLAQGGARSITLVARREDEARAAADLVHEAAPACAVAGIAWEGDVRRVVAHATLLVQATPLGMTGGDRDPRASATMIAALEAAAIDTVAMDMVYAPRETPWLQAARAKGLRDIDGLGMLAHQGALALARWFDIEPPAAALRRFLDAADAAG